jgi:hypothetical protein
MPRGAALEAGWKTSPRQPLEACPASAPARKPTAPLWTAFKGHPAHRLWPKVRERRRRR